MTWKRNTTFVLLLGELQSSHIAPPPTPHHQWASLGSTSLPSPRPPLPHQTNFKGDLDPPFPGHYYFYTVGKTNMHVWSGSIISVRGHSRDANAGISSCYTTLDHWIILFKSWLSHHGLWVIIPWFTNMVCLGVNFGGIYLYLFYFSFVWRCKPCWLSINSYPMLDHGVIVQYTIQNNNWCLTHAKYVALTAWVSLKHTTSKCNMHMYKHTWTQA